jgi:hypothetical protein
MTWVKYALLILIVEKIVQHVVVTLALYFNWRDTSSTVAVNPAILMVAGAAVAILFALCLWGMLSRKTWALSLLIGLAIFDILGEFIAQGTLAIAINVSFLVAIALLVLAIVCSRGERKLSSA